MNEDQSLAFEQFKEFLNSDKKIMTIYGAAGTGKTFMLRHISNYLDIIKERYILCAPTHRACLVLRQYTDSDVITLHKLLSLQPKLDIFDLDFSDLQFYSLGDQEFPTRGVIIIDEASMISDELYNFLMSKVNRFNTKILAIGDIKQLQPVKGYTVSKIFECDHSVELTQLMRQNEENPLISTLDILRNDVIKEFPTNNPSIHVYYNGKKFIDAVVPLFQSMLNTENVNETKLLAYTNKEVQLLNQILRRNLFRDDTPYHLSEILTGYENFSYNDYQFWNSMDYVIVEEPKQLDIYIPYFSKLPGYLLKLYDGVDDYQTSVFILDNNIPEDIFEQLAYSIEDRRLSAITASKYNRKRSAILWREYYKIMNSFALMGRFMYFDNRIIKHKTFDYGYAISVHKSQGCSLDNVCVDMRNINSCKDLNILRQLQYVSLSRTRNQVYLLE